MAIYCKQTAARRIIFSRQQMSFSPTLSLFRQVGSLFRQVGSLIRQSLCSQVSGSPLESRRSDRTASSLQFSSAKFKIAVSLAAEFSGGTLSSPAPFQVDDRRSCNGWHVSHAFDSQRVTNSGPKRETQV